MSVSEVELQLGRKVDASVELYTHFLQELLKIPTPRMQEHAAIRFLGAALQEAGLNPFYFEGEGIGEPLPDGLPLNLFACRRGVGGGKSLMIEAHMDTPPTGKEEEWIEGPWSGRIEGGRIYGRGAHDDRIGTAMLWMIADLLHHLDPGLLGDLYFLVTTEEEYSGGGMRAYVKRPDRVYPDAHLALDGNRTPYCMAGHAGAMSFEIRIPGAWDSVFYRDREKETNAIKLASQLVGVLERFEADVKRRTQALGVDPKWPDPIVAVTKIGCNGWFSNTPEECVLRGFVNVMPPMTLAEYKPLLHDFLLDFSRQHPWLEAHPPCLRWGPVEVPSMETPLDSEFYRTLASCHEKYFQTALRPRYTGGWGDMILLGCPNLIFYGPGGGGGDHSYNEYFELADLGPMLKAVGALVLRWNRIPYQD
jgi:acetylornithine deacetylase